MARQDSPTCFVAPVKTAAGRKTAQGKPAASSAARGYKLVSKIPISQLVMRQQPSAKARVVAPARSAETTASAPAGRRPAAGGAALKRRPATTHPGALLRDDVVPAFGRSPAQIARLLGVSPRRLKALLDERAALTAEMALRLGKLCGNGPEPWLELQAHYDLARLSKAKRAAIAAIPTLAAV